MKLSEAALAEAVARLGVHEVGGNNRGPEVEAMLALVHLPPGQPWCAATIYACFEMGARKLRLVNPVPRTGSCARLYLLSEPICRQTNPQVGDVYVLSHGPGKGHAGIVETVDELGNVATEISGNTNAAGSREGNCVARHHGQPEVSHGGMLVGYLRFDLAAQHPDSA